MRRFVNSYRQVTSNFGKFNQLIPITRRAIAPGQTIRNMRVNCRVSTATLSRYVLNPAYMQVFAFYVPYRLVWDDWPLFVAGDDATPSVPTDQAAWPIIFDNDYGGTVDFQVLGRRAFKLIQNQFFGQEEYSGSWYSDITADAVVQSKNIKTWDQYWSRRTQVVPTQDVFQAVVTTGLADIPLSDFARAMRDNRSKTKQQLTGDKYVDSMRAMGVQLDWRVQNAPEYLGRVAKIISPIYTSSTDPTALETRKSRYEGLITMNMSKPKSFAEHGEIFICAALRPAYITALQRMDLCNMIDRDDFFMGDNSSTYDETSTGGGRARFLGYNAGMNVEGSTNALAADRPWLTNEPTVFDEYIFPDPDQVANEGEYGEKQIAIVSDVSIRSKTPVPQNSV
jgi:hypothetical protein